MQAAMGGRPQGVHTSVVELVGLHNALTLFMYHITPPRSFHPLQVPGDLRSDRQAQDVVAGRRPDARIRGSLRDRQRLQLRPNNLPVPSEPAAWPPSDLSRMYAHRYRKVLLYILSCHYVIRLWSQSALLFLFGHRSVYRTSFRG